MVVAAGNEGNDQFQWQGCLQEKTNESIDIHIGDKVLQFVDSWVPRRDHVYIESVSYHRFCAYSTFTRLSTTGTHLTINRAP